MNQSTDSSTVQTASLAELLDARPDTREMISANLDLAHACLELKNGDVAQAEQILSAAKDESTPGHATISTCIKAEIRRLGGRASEAWDLAEELVARDRFDTIAALYLRFLFPFHAREASAPPPPPAPTVVSAPPSEAPARPAVVAASPEPPPVAVLPPPPPVLAEEPAPSVGSSLVGEASLHALHDVPSQSFHDPDSEVSLAVEHDASADDVPVAVGELPPSLAKLTQDESIQLMRLRTPDGAIAETVRAHQPIGDLDDALLERTSSILEALHFGRLVHAGFEGACGAAHVWNRSGRTLYLVVGQSASAPALAARCSRAMEDLA